MLDMADFEISELRLWDLFYDRDGNSLIPRTRTEGGTSEPLYVMPAIQRPYSWGSKEIEEFCQDMFNSVSRGHVFGVIKLAKNGTKFEVVDGQQRLTAALLFCHAVSLRFPEIPSPGVAISFLADDTQDRKKPSFTRKQLEMIIQHDGRQGDFKIEHRALSASWEAIESAFVGKFESSAFDEQAPEALRVFLESTLDSGAELSPRFLQLIIPERIANAEFVNQNKGKPFGDAEYLKAFIFEGHGLFRELEDDFVQSKTIIKRINNVLKRGGDAKEQRTMLETKIEDLFLDDLGEPDYRYRNFGWWNEEGGLETMKLRLETGGVDYRSKETDLYKEMVNSFIVHGSEAYPPSWATKVNYKQLPSFTWEVWQEDDQVLNEIIGSSGPILDYAYRRIFLDSRGVIQLGKTVKFSNTKGGFGSAEVSKAREKMEKVKNGNMGSVDFDNFLSDIQWANVLLDSFYKRMLSDNTPREKTTARTRFHVGNYIKANQEVSNFVLRNSSALRTMYSNSKSLRTGMQYITTTHILETMWYGESSFDVSSDKLLDKIALVAIWVMVYEAAYDAMNAVLNPKRKYRNLSKDICEINVEGTQTVAGINSSIISMIEEEHGDVFKKLNGLDIKDERIIENICGWLEDTKRSAIFKNLISSQYNTTLRLLPNIDYLTEDDHFISESRLQDALVKKEDYDSGLFKWINHNHIPKGVNKAKSKGTSYQDDPIPYLHNVTPRLIQRYCSKIDEATIETAFEKDVNTSTDTSIRRVVQEVNRAGLKPVINDIIGLMRQDLPRKS